MKTFLSFVVRRVLTKYNLAWVNKCNHTRSPDVFKLPLPLCPECGK